MRRTHKQKVKKLQELVLGDSFKTPTEYEIDTNPIQLNINGKTLIVKS